MWQLSRGLLALGISTRQGQLSSGSQTPLQVVVAILRVIGWRQDIDIVCNMIGSNMKASLVQPGGSCSRVCNCVSLPLPMLVMQLEFPELCSTQPDAHKSRL